VIGWAGSEQKLDHGKELVEETVDVAVFRDWRAVSPGVAYLEVSGEPPQQSALWSVR
jgi:hypothetical protein